MRRLKPALPALALLTVLAAAVQLGASAPVQKALSSAKLIMPHDRYTSVEIVDHEAVPAVVAAGTTLDLRVRVSNHQGLAMFYTVVPRLTTLADRDLRADTVKRISVPDGASVTVPLSIVMPSCVGRIRAEVSLLGRTEMVHALVSVRSRARPVVRCG